MTHSKPCVPIHVFTRHMASHVSTCMDVKLCINGGQFVERGGGGGGGGCRK